MPDAVIVATARSPIGRAGRGSMTTIRPDDLLAQMVAAVMAKVPEVDPATISDLLVGCGQPAGTEKTIGVVCLSGASTSFFLHASISNIPEQDTTINNMVIVRFISSRWKLL